PVTTYHILLHYSLSHHYLHSFPTRRSSDLFVYACEIFANDTKADNQQTANDKLEQNYRSETRKGAAGQFQVQCLDSQTNRKEKKDYASKRNQMQWERRKRRYPD